MKMNIGSTLSVQSETALKGAVERMFMVAGMPLTAYTPMMEGTDKAMATGTERKSRTSIMAMHQAPPMAAVGLVKRPTRQTATRPKPMVRARAPGGFRREPEGSSWGLFCVLPSGVGPVAEVSVFAFTGRFHRRLVSRFWCRRRVLPVGRWHGRARVRRCGR